MGIINLDPYPLNYTNQSVTSSYIHTQVNDSINIRKVNSNTYEMNTYFHVHYNQEAYTSGMSAIGGVSVNIQVTKTDMHTIPVYTLFYNRLKEMYPNYTDLEPDITPDP